MAVTMTGGGLLFSGTSRRIDGIPRQELRELLLTAAHRLLLPGEQSEQAET
ncbi:hypothetical protein ACQEWB_04465 [Streptomyces sp. CA-249302]|uniref:hypothetical protein n=1 Tax=Streptomyces sp. CA-249302 TaxID=3240058 RepID=UPI003D8A6074